MHDHPEPVMQLFLVAIVSGYIIIAYQWFRLMVRTRMNYAKWALSFLIWIFLLCAMSGYAPGFLPIPYWMQIVSHGLLVIFTWAFIFTKQIHYIHRVLENDV